MNDEAASPKILDKIRNLISLSNSSNEHEAANAAAHAARLMAKHGIDSIEHVNAAHDPVSDNHDLYVEIGRGKHLVTWKWNLAWVVAISAQCKPYKLHRQYGDQIIATLIAFIGRRSDSEICCVLYEYLIDELRRFHGIRQPPIGKLIQQYVPGRAAPAVDREFQRKWSRDFYSGVISVLHDRMNQAREEVMETASSTALVLLGKLNVQIDDLATEMGLQYVKSRAPDVRSEHGWTAGVMAGREIDLDPDTDPLALPVTGLKKP